jgi:hypothetical protein
MLYFISQGSTPSLSLLRPWLPRLYFLHVVTTNNRLCGLVVRVSGYRYRGPGFDSRRYKIFREVVVLERGPLSLVRIRSYLNRKVAAQVKKTELTAGGIRCADHSTPSIRKS